MERFSTASHAARVTGLLDPASFTPLANRGARTSLIAGGGHLEGEAVWIAATDPSRARGALGVAEADALCALFQTARDEPRPLLLLVDSAGAKVDEGLAVLGAFRRLFREALLTRLAQVPMLGLLGKSCFGGASLLACVCSLRVYSSDTLFAASGPGVIEALGGKGELDAADPHQVRALMGGDARARLAPSEQLATDSIDAFRDRAVHLLQSEMLRNGAFDLATDHAALRRRLAQNEGHIHVTTTERDMSIRRLERLLPAGYAPEARGHVCLGLPSPGAEKPAFAGFLSGGTVGAEACWDLADALVDLHASNPRSPVLLLLDAVGHAATRHDEASMLSAYLTHLSFVGAWLVRCGHQVSLWIPGAAAGAVYVAFAAPAGHVSALHSARIRILPEIAVRQILGASAAQSADSDVLVDTGVVDGLLDRRLEGYAAVANGS
jgi:hypothetical protein